MNTLEDDNGSKSSDMPVWLDISPNDSDRLDCAWLTTKLGQYPNESTIVSCTVQDMSNQGRLGVTGSRDGATLLLTATLQTNTSNEASVQRHYIMKQVPPSRAGLSQRLGLAREALFYKHLAPMLGMCAETNDSAPDDDPLVPRVDYAFGDMGAGVKCIIMEALLPPRWIDSGILFGPGNPNNWKRDLPALVAAAYPHTTPPTAHHVAKDTFIAMARVHAKFWNMDMLLQSSYGWLRGQAWLLGQGQDTWQASQGLVQRIWSEYTNGVHDGPTVSPLVWDATVRDSVTAAMSQVSWTVQCQRLSVTTPWTLVHGDCWPGNVLRATDGTHVRLIDWEMVGLGSGPQDLGQYVISNMDPAERRSGERDLVQSYHDELIRLGVTIHDGATSESTTDDALWNYCWKEYTVGGIERWIWFLVYFLGQPSMRDWAQFFHDQMASFMKDHALTADDISQPRP